MLRGEIWLVKLDPTLGTEISKTRPAIIVNDNAIGILLLKVIVPVTDWKEPFAARPWMVRLEPNVSNGLSKLSGADTFQVRSVSETRLVKQLGKLDETTNDDDRQSLSDRACNLSFSPSLL
ncbi:MAG: type II toxin-antitoxin system PemK/MazF family toxin [Tildeniella nuda ZEHNDER 1965/U140]|jgi:mRNA interferase MazF|nr:type II toxin-antitoxin system PemK/MazF family toxin [Tildeniella nuda ZEHNDER 1965/U140]